MMRVSAHWWWLRQVCFFIVAEVLGYLLAIELRDRYPQQLCFIAVFCAITALDELNSRLKRRGAVIPRHPPGA
jgi:hypothetical protein